ncbi:MAG TPA: hypothetical protein VFR81_20575 [Longimicrobium sp.]|nr:hypothetical protein [Longimicrobium sp.]
MVQRSHLLLALLAALAGCRSPDPPPRVGAPAELVGTPFTETSRYARNVWDMQLFRGRIHLGHGDSGENRGPVALWSLDPVTGRLERGFETREEQVDVFRIVDGELYVPGHDPRGRRSHGGFYRLKGERWIPHRTIPHAVHAFDLASHGSRLFVAIGSGGRTGHPTLLASADRGRTWTPVTDEVQRMYSLFVLRDTLYAAPKLGTRGPPAGRALLRFDGARFVSTGLGGAVLLPGLADTAGRIIRPVEFRGVLVYVVAGGTFDWKPAVLAVAHNLDAPRTRPLPSAEAVPYDLLVRGDTLYVLAATPSPSGGYLISVYATDDLERWRELFRFDAPTFARSFEESGGDFFLGLGSTFRTPSPATGAVLRVRRASYANP